MKLDHIWGSQTHHGDEPKNPHQTPFFQAMKSCQTFHCQPERWQDEEFAIAECTQRHLELAGTLFFLEVCMLLVEMLFYPFMRTSSFPRTVYRCQPLKPQA